MVLTPCATSSFSIENISCSGALLVGDLLLAQSDRVKLLLQIEGEATLGATADVVRVHTGALDRQHVAVRFFEPDDPTQQRIRAIVHSALQRRWISAAPAICVVADSPDTSVMVERDTHVLGWTLVSAATSTDVIAHLRDPSLRFEAAIVDVNLERVNAPAVLRHLAEEHPHTRRVLIGSTTSEAAGTEVASGRAHAFLQSPWDRNALLRALGAPGTEGTAPVPVIA
jgi:ActR/RegA family two-component response regulator